MTPHTLFDLVAGTAAYRRAGKAIERIVEPRTAEACVVARLPNLADAGLDPQSAFDQSWLRSSRRPIPRREQAAPVRVVDLFAGAGGLTLGVEAAAWHLGRRIDVRLASDVDQRMLEIYQRNFDPAWIIHQPIESVLEGELGSPPTPRELDLWSKVGPVDLLVAGPPCQGHSNLNNHTRRQDPRNRLYSRVARAAEILSPKHVIIENVPGVVHDQGGVVDDTASHLRALGYSTDGAVISANELGVAQTRKRFLMAASSRMTPYLKDAMDSSATEDRSVVWAIGDLGVNPGSAPFDTPSKPTPVTEQRLKHLFDNGLFELPDRLRPACHRDKAHTYQAVYGRMYPDRPAPTITIGFGTMGQGRFVHPTEPRTLTPHEAARIQGFPDWFGFEGLSRSHLHKAIGNAVPPKLAQVVAEHMLGS